MGFLQNGSQLKKEFISHEIVTKLNRELDEIFASPTINSSKGYIKTSNVVKTVPFPFVFIRSVNLLELAIDVADYYKSLGVDIAKYKLCELEVYEEFGDKKELGWHTDGPNGLLALIYLQGGNQESGGSLYMNGTHLIDHGEGYHYLDKAERQKRASSLVDLSGQPSDMVIYDLNGFHSRHPTNKVRRAIRLLFSPVSVSLSQFDDITLPVSSLTPRVLQAMPNLLTIRNETPAFSQIAEVFPNNYFVAPRFVGTANLLKYFVYHMSLKYRRKFSSMRRSIKLNFSRIRKDLF